MLLVLLTLVSSLAGMLGVLRLFQVFAPTSVWAIPACIATGLGVALWWSRGHARMVRAAVRGRDAALLRTMRIWGSLHGPMESLLVELSLAAERRSAAAMARLLDEATRRGLGSFARAWAQHLVARAEQNLPAALQHLQEGIVHTQGIDRAELCCEAVLVRCHLAAHRDGLPMADDEVRHLIDLLNTADAALRGAPTGGPWRTRARYVHAFHTAARGLCYAAQDRPAEAARKLGEAIAALRQAPGVRGARLAELLEVERLVASRPLLPAGQYHNEVLQRTPRAVLPLVQRRLVALAAGEAARAAPATGAAPVPAAGLVLPPDGPPTYSPAPGPGGDELGLRSRRRPRAATDPGQQSLFRNPIIDPPVGEARPGEDA